MDKPTMGLYLEDIRKLLAMLQKLVDSSHTLVVVEHNLDCHQIGGLGDRPRA